MRPDSGRSQVTVHYIHKKTIDFKRILTLPVLASQFGASTCLSHYSAAVSYVVELKLAKETY